MTEDDITGLIILLYPSELPDHWLENNVLILKFSPKGWTKFKKNEKKKVKDIIMAYPSNLIWWAYWINFYQTIILLYNML